MRPTIEGLRRYLGIEPVPKLTPEELAEVRILSEVLNASEAPQLLLAEKQRKWGGLGRIIRSEELRRDNETGVYRLETALAFFRRNQQTVVAVGAQRILGGFGVYVARDEERVYTGQVGDERLRLELRRAFGRLTMDFRRKGIA